jgi:hypothetical protein
MNQFAHGAVPQADLAHEGDLSAREKAWRMIFVHMLGGQRVFQPPDFGQLRN